MLTIKAEVQKDRKRMDGTYNIKIRFTKDRAVKRISTNLFVTKEDLTADLKLKESSMIKQEADRLVLHYRSLLNSLHLDQENHDVNEIVNRLLNKDEADKPIDFIAFCKSDYKGKWYKFNDGLVYECDFYEVKTSGMPYVLFYSSMNF